MSSELKKFKFQSSDGNHKLTGYVWSPTNAQIYGVVQIIHGMREHMGRYADFAAFLNAKGYVVYGSDHLGHGESAKESCSYGYISEKNGATYLVNDCHRLTEIIKKQNPDVPIFLLGHSLGSFIGNIYVTHYAKDIAGYICMGTGGENPFAAVGRVIAAGLSRFGYSKKEGKLLDKIAFGNFNSHFEFEASKSAWLSRDYKIAEAFDNDEHTKALFTNGAFCDMLDLQMAATSKKWARCVPKNLPILLVSGTDDPVGDYGKGVTSVYERLKKAGANVTCKLYLNARHEILNELNKEEVYFDCYSWMEDNKYQ